MRVESTKSFFEVHCNILIIADFHSKYQGLVCIPWAHTKWGLGGNCQTYAKQYEIMY